MMDKKKKLWFTLLAGGGAAQLTPPTEMELLAAINIADRPNIVIRPDDGVYTDVSGNNVAVSSLGTPTIETGGQNNKKFLKTLSINGDGLVMDRVDHGTMVCVFRTNAGAGHVINVPTSNTGGGDAPKFFKQGIVVSSSRYRFLPDSNGTKKGIDMDEAVDGNWKAFVCRGEGYAHKNGQSKFRAKLTAIADTTVNKMFFNGWGRGDGANFVALGDTDLLLYMVWDHEVSDDVLSLIEAYVEIFTGDLYSTRTYLYRASTLEFDSNNAVFQGNSFSESTQDQFYRVQLLPEGVGIGKGLAKNLYGTTTNDFINFTDQPAVIATGSFGEWDSNGHNISCTVKDGDTYYLFITGRDASSNFQIGLATSSSPLSGFTKDAGNPIITLTTVNTALTKTYNSLAFIKGWKKDGVYYCFIGARDSTGTFNPKDVILCTGSAWNTWNTFTYKFSTTDTILKPHVSGYTTTKDDTGFFGACIDITGLDFVEQGGKLTGYIGIGCNTDELTTTRAHHIFPIIAEDDGNYNFKIVCDVAIDSGSHDYDRNMVYLPAIMIKQDGQFTKAAELNGKWVITYANLGLTSEAVNTKGWTSIAYAPNKRIVENLLN